MPADREAIKKKNYKANKDARLLKNDITSIL